MAKVAVVGHARKSLGGGLRELRSVTVCVPTQAAAMSNPGLGHPRRSLAPLAKVTAGDRSGDRGAGARGACRPQAGPARGARRPRADTPGRPCRRRGRGGLGPDSRSHRRPRSSSSPPSWPGRPARSSPPPPWSDGPGRTSPTSTTTCRHRPTRPGTRPLPAVSPPPWPSWSSATPAAVAMAVPGPGDRPAGARRALSDVPRRAPPHRRPRQPPALRSLADRHLRADQAEHRQQPPDRETPIPHAQRRYRHVSSCFGEVEIRGI
jgi:hypothetical protein